MAVLHLHEPAHLTLPPSLTGNCPDLASVRCRCPAGPLPVGFPPLASVMPIIKTDKSKASCKLSSESVHGVSIGCFRSYQEIAN